MHDINYNSPESNLDRMNQQQKVKGGMKLFTELVNKSDKVNMYPVITSPEG